MQTPVLQSNNLVIILKIFITIFLISVLYFLDVAFFCKKITKKTQNKTTVFYFFGFVFYIGNNQAGASRESCQMKRQAAHLLLLSVPMVTPATRLNQPVLKH